MTAEPAAQRSISSFDFGEPIAGRVHEVLAEGFGEQ